MANVIALVDHDRSTLDFSRTALEAEGFEVRPYTDAIEAWKGLTAQPADLAVLEIKMPRMDGIELLSRLRKDSAMPVIFLAAKIDEVDEVLALRMGANDYLKKSVSRRILAERIRVLLRRAPRAQDLSDGEPPIRRGDLWLDMARHQCTWKGLAVHLTATEVRLLQLLALRPGHVKSRDQLMDGAFSDRGYADASSINSHVKRLRQKFKMIDPNFEQIESLYGIGYRFCDARERVPAC
jgi:two-component system response regulator ChvI